MDRRARAVMIAFGASVVLGSTAVAQKVPGIPSGTQVNPGTVKVVSGNYIVIGCVGRDGPGDSQFTITDGRGTPPARYRLQGDGDLLRFHVGHMVEIGGPIRPAVAGATMATLDVKALTYVSRTCAKQR
jgi:hypothetical protein